MPAARPNPRTTRHVLTYISLAIGITGFLWGAFFARRLYRWETLLSRARVKVYFKGKTAMTPRLLDLVLWADKLQKDKQVNGQVIFKQGGTTIALAKAHKRVPKAKQSTVKETNRWGKRADSPHGSPPPKEGRLKASLGTKKPPKHS